MTPPANDPEAANDPEEAGPTEEAEPSTCVPDELPAAADSSSSPPPEDAGGGFPPEDTDSGFPPSSTPEQADVALPADLAKAANLAVLKLQQGGTFDGGERTTTYHIVGTSHVSHKSVEDVRRVIRAVKPEVVMLELCQQRTATLQPVDRSQLRDKNFQHHLALWREGREPLLAVVYSWMLSSVADKCEISPGEEFRVALEEASKAGAKVMLGDRLVSVTLARTWAALSLWQKVKFCSEMLWVGLFVPGKEVDALMDSMTGDSDVLTEAVRDLGHAYPQLLRTLIEERDEFMVCMLRSLAPQAERVVAVVGAGHLRGLQDKWEADIDVEELARLPPARPARPWRTYLLVAAAGSAALAVTVAVVRRRQR